MHYLLVKETAIRDFFALLDPHEQVHVMPLNHPFEERIYYHVSGLTRDWIRHTTADESFAYMWEQF